jgi:C-terminal processing protease CtpA/Prc
MRTFFKISVVIGMLLGMAVAGAQADEIHLKSGGRVKGLVLENYEDRLLVSTVEGEQVFLKQDIANVDYDDPAYAVLNLAREKEAAGKMPQALAYYEKAYELNENLAEAKQAALGIRSKLWANMSAKPVSSVAKQQDIEDAYRANISLEEQASKNIDEEAELLGERLGVRLEKAGDWVIVGHARLGSSGHKYGMRAKDRLVGVDGKSLRYLSVDAVGRELLEPRNANAVLDMERDLVFNRDSKHRKLKHFGFSVKQKYEGLTISQVKRSTPADDMKLEPGGLITRIDDEPTRYMSTRDAIRRMEKSDEPYLEITVQTRIQFVRK